ncbi:glycosyltransferase [Aureliella helgolandensis]|uniref:Glycosyl transferase family 2 n=1 Tax=Aureliella helgolandensis TaxID=2527968 RepID=A0A518G0H8_9BACT|nr:glycosyltransferase [Aureliella helgolandensis]QDV22103.1 Glycosyl transferase family 2 [Aureliella helgolandensis]
MFVSGFTIVRNAVQYDYPVVESIRSILPAVDEMIVAVGNSCDATRELIESIGSPKIRIIDTVWDDAQRRGGTVLAQQTNLALAECTGDWCFYIQADEVVHEQDLARIQATMRRYEHSPSVDAISFRYHHFRADYGIRDPLPYRRQVRIVRPQRGIQSVGDACGFGRGDHKLKSVSCGAWIYHYGYVKPPQNMAAKNNYFQSLYDGRMVTPGEASEAREYAWNLRTCEAFQGTHPQVMNQRIANKNWETPPAKLVYRWRNPIYWQGLLYKNTRTFRRMSQFPRQLLSALRSPSCLPTNNAKQAN